VLKHHYLQVKLLRSFVINILHAAKMNIFSSKYVIISEAIESPIPYDWKNTTFIATTRMFFGEMPMLSLLYTE